MAKRKLAKLAALKTAYAAVPPRPWTVDWYVCRAGREDVKAGSATRVGAPLWRVARAIGPISPDHNHWAGHHVADEKVAELVEAAHAALPALMEAAELLAKLTQAVRSAKLSEGLLTDAEAVLAKL